MRLRRVFVSYARADTQSAERLAQAFRQLGLDPWIDNELSGGQRWWDEVLKSIRACDIFVFCQSRASLESRACQEELGYAVALRRILLPVIVAESPSDVLLPPVLAETQRIDFTAENGVTSLARALLTLEDSPLLPDPLPPTPPVPATYLTQLQTKVREPPTSMNEQVVLVADLRALWRIETSREPALELLRELREHRRMLAGVVVDDIEDMLAGSAEHPETHQPVDGPEMISESKPGITLLKNRPTKKTFLLLVGGKEFEIEVGVDAVKVNRYEIEFELLSVRGELLGTMSDRTYGFTIEAAEEKTRVEVRLRYVNDYNVIRGWQVSVAGIVVFSRGSLPDVTP